MTVPKVSKCRFGLMVHIRTAWAPIVWRLETAIRSCGATRMSDALGKAIVDED
jgi:hypothetical protein